MKPKRFQLILATLLLIFTLTACAAGAVPTQTPSTPIDTVEAPVEPLPMPTSTITDLPGGMSTQSASPTEQPQAAPTHTVDVYTLILEKLDGNHSPDRVFNAQKTREEWNTTLDRMIGYGAKINEEEKQLIIDYLLNRQ